MSHRRCQSPFANTLAIGQNLGGRRSFGRTPEQQACVGIPPCTAQGALAENSGGWIVGSNSSTMVIPSARHAAIILSTISPGWGNRSRKL
jgi:hypothetical protein